MKCKYYRDDCLMCEYTSQPCQHREFGRCSVKGELTNADVVRTFTDENLADYMLAFTRRAVNAVLEVLEIEGSADFVYELREELLALLKSPAKEKTDEKQANT